MEFRKSCFVGYTGLASLQSLMKKPQCQRTLLDSWITKDAELAGRDAVGVGMPRAILINKSHGSVWREQGIPPRETRGGFLERIGLVGQSEGRAA